MQKKSRLAVVLVSAMFFAFGVAGCENMAGWQKVQKIEIGKPAPDFAVQDIAGRTWKLSSFRGKVVFVNFWATWCQPCRDEMPSVAALNKDMAGQPFQMLTIVYNDDLQLAESFARKHGATFPVLAKYAPEVIEAYMVTGVPETFLIDANGILRHKFIGPFNWDSPEMKNMVLGLINNPGQ